jgi:hypothetical protein
MTAIIYREAHGGRVTIDADDVKAIARRVAELVGQLSRLVDAQSVAAAVDVEREWVYAHARELGVVRLGPGPKARMRFHLTVVRERITALAQVNPPAAPEPRRRQRHPRRTTIPGVQLIQCRSSR